MKRQIMRTVITLPTGETKPLMSSASIKDISNDKTAIFILDNEEILNGYTTDGSINDSGEIILMCKDTGICIGVLLKRIIGWCYN